MEKELVDKIVDKKFIELTASEKVELQEWFTSEEEFDQMKAVFTAVEQMKAEQIFIPKAETKRSLDELFAQKNAKSAPVLWYNSVLVALYPTDKTMLRRPLMQIAAIGLVLLLVYPFLSPEKLMEEQKQIAKVEEKQEKKAEQEFKVEEIKPTTQVESPIETIITRESVLEESISDVIIADEISVSRASQPASGAFAFSSASDASAEKFDHPDGVFTGGSTVAYSQAASSQPAIFDLLTAAF